MADMDKAREGVGTGVNEDKILWATQGTFKLDDYFHKDDPITRTRKCDDCFGIGKIIQVSRPYDFEPPNEYEISCPSCHDGEIVEQWVVVDGECCQHWEQCQGHETIDCPPEYIVAEACIRAIEIPVTHGNAHEHMGKEGEWRAIEKAP